MSRCKGHAVTILQSVTGEQDNSKLTYVCRVQGGCMKIKLSHVSMVYPSGKEALKEIDLEVESPNLIGLLGPNGAGKTTFMKLLVSALQPTRGEILVDDVALLKCETKLKSQLGYLPQHFGLYDELNVTQFLEYIAALKGIKNAKEAIQSAIEVTHLEEKKKSKIATLSGGQRQRVGIAQAILSNPQLLILDEPTVGLDPEERVQFRNYFYQASKDKIVFLSTHIIEDVQAVCNQLIVINHGVILFCGTPEEMIERARGHIDLSKSINLGYRRTSEEPTLEEAYLYMIESEGSHK